MAELAYKENRSAQANTVAIVIPAYEPSEELIGLVKKIHSPSREIIIVNDGSDPAYTPIWNQIECFAYELQSTHISILNHTENQGKGAALKTAFRHIETELPHVEWIVTIDADGQHSPRDMNHVLRSSMQNPHSLILGVREFGENVPARSRFGNQLTRKVFKWVSGSSVSDTQTGLRAFDRSLLSYMLQISGSRYEYEMNVLLSCSKNKIDIKEIPIQTIYHDKENSCSHFDGIRDSLRIYSQILKFASSSLVSFCADYVLFILLAALFPPGAWALMLANIIARVFSAGLNYTLNTKMVFKNEGSGRQTLPQYAILAIFILTMNNMILLAYTNALMIPEAGAKLMTEVTLFIISFLVQSKIIFNNHSKGEDSHEQLAFLSKKTC